MIDPENPEVKEVVKSWTLGIRGSKNRINETNFKVYFVQPKFMENVITSVTVNKQICSRLKFYQWG